MVLPVVAALWASMPNRAAADFIFNLTVPNPAIAGFTGPYAQVDVHLVSGTEATVTFTSLTNSGNIYLMGDGSTVALNVNAGVSSLSATVSGSNAGTGFTPGPYTANIANNQQVDGFGKFNFTVDSFDGYTHSSDTVVVDLKRSTGNWSTANDVLINNAQLADAAAHIFVTSSPANASNGAIVTGFAGPGGSINVPEPSSIALGLVGLVGLGVTQIRRLVRRNALALS